MLRLYIVRHGETNSSLKGTYCGWTDVWLNEEGVIQAGFLKENLKCVKFRSIFSSPLLRARRTAEIINEYHNIDIVCDNNLKERNFGIWEDLTFQEIMGLYPDDYASWMADWKNFGIRNGESAAQAYERGIEFVRNIGMAYKSGNILIVTHLGCIRMMLSYLFGMEIDGLWRFRVDSGSLTIVEINQEGFAYLTALNIKELPDNRPIKMAENKL